LACNPTYLNANGSAWNLSTYICSQECVVPPFCPQHIKNGTAGGDGQVTCFCERSNRTVGIMSLGSALSTRSHGPRTRPSGVPVVCRYGTTLLSHGQCLTGPHVIATKTGLNETAVLTECCAICVAPQCSGWTVMQIESTFRCDAFGATASVTTSINCTVAATRDRLIGGSWNWGTMAVSKGNWLSTPISGECTGKHRPGDGSGCSWRAHAAPAIIETVCLRTRLVDAFLAADPICFALAGSPWLDTFYRCVWMLLNGDQVVAKAVWADSVRAFAAAWLPHPAGCLNGTL
jgi:hypothetical protein